MSPHEELERKEEEAAVLRRLSAYAAQSRAHARDALILVAYLEGLPARKIGTRIKRLREAGCIAADRSAHGRAVTDAI